MLLNPSILALLIVSLLVTLLMLLAAAFGFQVLRHWDINSGSERQLRMERQTYLISTIVAFSFMAELISLLLFIYNAEQMSTQFVGAMCATGVLNVNQWGWTTLYIKMGIFFSGAAWLSLNRVDNLAWDYPLVRVKYGLLLLLLPLLLAEAVAQTRFFLEMSPDVITSCCGSLFTPEGEGIASEISAVQPDTALLLLTVSGVFLILCAAWFLWSRRGALLFSASTLAAFVIALVAIVSCIALYIYEHPHHHCPFCILKSGHDFMGYYLYVPLFLAAASAAGMGIIAPFRRIPSLQQVIACDSRRHAIIALCCMLIFYAVSGFAILRSNLTMVGVWW